MDEFTHTPQSPSLEFSMCSYSTPFLTWIQRHSLMGFTTTPCVAFFVEQGCMFITPTIREGKNVDFNLKPDDCISNPKCWSVHIPFLSKSNSNAYIFNLEQLEYVFSILTAWMWTTLPYILLMWKFGSIKAHMQVRLTREQNLHEMANSNKIWYFPFDGHGTMFCKLEYGHNILYGCQLSSSQNVWFHFCKFFIS